MNKKIEEAAREYSNNNSEGIGLGHDDDAFKAGAEWAFNECIKIIDKTVKTPEELGTKKLVIGALLVKDEIKYLYLSSEGKNDKA